MRRAVASSTVATLDSLRYWWPMADSARLRWVTWIVIAACLVGMALSPRLWIGDRSFPVLPLAPSLQVPAVTHEVLTAGFVIALLAMGVWPGRRWIPACLCLLAAALILLDLSRLQPWFYLYMFLLAIVGCRRAPSDDAAAAGTMRMLLVFVYAYSAAHKLHASFFEFSGPAILRPLAQALPESWPVGLLAYAMPAGELALAALLAFPRTRGVGVGAAFAMHTVILLLIGPIGLNYNSVVWPWNVAMPALGFLVFWPRRAAASLPSPAPRSRWASSARIATILLAGVLPAGGIAGLVDRYVSWGMYGGAPTIMAVWFNVDVESRLPPHLQREVQSLSAEMRGIVILDWSMHDLSVAYPESHLMLRAARTLERFVHQPREATLDIVYEPDRFTGRSVRLKTPIQPGSRR